MANYYDILGVAKDATEQDIKAAFRKLSLKYHPDRNPDDKVAEDKFKEINEAYQTLSDAEKRQVYDMGGQQHINHGSPIDDILRNMGFNINMDFTQQVNPFAQNNKNMQITQQVSISLKDAVFGCELDLNIPSYIDCSACNGIGGTKANCHKCAGAGRNTRYLGAMQYSSTCVTCNGKGYTLTSTCAACNQEGIKKQTRHIKLKVPAGIQHQTALHIAPAPNDRCDVFIIVNVAKHPTIHRNGATLFSTAKVSCLDAITGGTIKVDTIDGVVDLTIPAGTQQGQQLTINGHGGVLSNGRANHVVNIHIDIPTDLTAAQIKKIKDITKH